MGKYLYSKVRYYYAVLLLLRWLVVSDSFQPHELQHASLPCPSLFPGVCSNSRPLNLWCREGVSSSFVPFTSALNLSQHQGLFQWSSSSNEYSELISFRIDWFDLLVAQGALRSILQHHSSKALIFRHSAFFIVQLSHPHMITRKTKALTRWTLVGKIMSLLFKMLSRLVIAFLPRSKCLLISWLQSTSAVILEPPPPNTVCHCFHCFPIYLPWSDGTGCHDLSFLNVAFSANFFTLCLFHFCQKAL